MKLLLFLGALAAASGQTVVANLDTAKWDKSGGVLLRTDPASGGMDLLVRLPAGHVIPAHFHDSNEHVIVVEGELTLLRTPETLQ
jgi:quercetin dioxygenase-like cupin family protein